MMKRVLFETWKAAFSGAPAAPCASRVPNLAGARKAHSAGPGCPAEEAKINREDGQSEAYEHLCIYIYIMFLYLFPVCCCGGLLSFY